jgi:hypothetical protein
VSLLCPGERPHSKRQPRPEPGRGYILFVRLILLLALAVSLRRMLVRRFGFLHRLGGLLLRAYVVVAAVLLRRGTMSFRSLLVMFGGLFVRFFGHLFSSLLGKFGGNARRAEWFELHEGETRTGS